MNLKHKYNLVDNKYVNMLCSSPFNEWGHHNGHLNDSSGMLIEVGLKQWYIIYIFSLKMDPPSTLFKCTWHKQWR